MKEFAVSGHCIPVGEYKKLLCCQGDSNCDTLRFRMDRYCDAVDLSQCCCSVKTKNSAGKADVLLPEVKVSGDKLEVLWIISSASASVSGKLLAQLQFEKIFEDKTRNIVWQSNIMEFEIETSLASADEVYDQNPTLFQQWEDKISSACADTVAGAKTAADNAKVSETSAADSEKRAAESSILAKTFCDTAQSANEAASEQAEAAKASADRAQKTADSFTGYTKQESDRRFANLFTGEKSGTALVFDDLLSGIDFCGLTLSGSVDGVPGASITVCGKNLFDYTKTKSTAAGNCVTLTGNGFTMKRSGNVRFAATVPVFIPKGTVFTVSADIIKNEIGTLPIAEFYLLDSSNTAIYSGIPVSPGYKVLTAKTDYTSITFFLSSVPDGTEVTLSNPQLELGDKRTGYEVFQAPSVYQAVPSAPLLAGETYDLISGQEIHTGSSFRQTPRAVPVNKTVLTSQGTLTLKYGRDSNAVYRELISKLKTV